MKKLIIILAAIFAVIEFKTNGQVHIKKNGFVGIGNPNPISLLDVNGIITASDGNSTNWNTAYSWGNHALAGYLTDSNTAVLTNKTGNISMWNNDIHYLTNYTETDPIWNSVSNNYYTKLNLQTSGSALIHFNNLINKPNTLAGYGITDNIFKNGGENVGVNRSLGNNDNYSLGLKTNNQTRLLISNDGNIGIGTNPSARKLEINGILSIIGRSDIIIGRDNSLYTTGGQARWVLRTNDDPDANDGTDAGSSFAFVSRHDNGSCFNYVLYLKRTGNIGIGTNNPKVKLEIKGNVVGYPVTSDTTQTNGLFRIGATPTDVVLDFGIKGGDSLCSWIQSTKKNNLGFLAPILLNPNGGQIIIGRRKNISKYTLEVKGGIYADSLLGSGYHLPDFVFESNYNLKTLNEVENYISRNKHLPDVPSAKEAEENGVNLGKMDAVLLQKIEELTLYVIEINKEMQKIKEENRELKNQIGSFK